MTNLDYTDDTSSQTDTGHHPSPLEALAAIRSRTLGDLRDDAAAQENESTTTFSSQAPLLGADAEAIEDDVDEGEADNGDGAVALHPLPPTIGPALLMPINPTGRGRSVWHKTTARELPRKMSAALKAGRVRRTRYVQPVDVLIPFAGSEATKASEAYGVVDGFAHGLLARQVAFAARLQKVAGPIDDTNEPRGTRPLGVCIMSTLSDDDHGAHLSPQALSRPSVGEAVRQAGKGRTSRAGPMRPLMVDAQGEVTMLSAGQGLMLAISRTGKIGGGKSLTAYANSSPADAVERQLQAMAILQHPLGASPRPMMLPPIISIGGTSFDAQLAFWASPPTDLPPGVVQWISTTPQDKLPHGLVAGATRKKIAAIVGLTCVDQGHPWNNIPVVMLDLNDPAVQDWVEFECMRHVLEAHRGLQPATTDRSDVTVYMNEFSAALGKGSQGSKFVILNEERPEIDATVRIQHRDLFLGHATNLNRGRIIGIATGSHDPGSLDRVMGDLVTRAFAQAYGRNAGEIMLRNAEIHRSKLKMVHVSLYIPDDLEATASLDELVRLENAFSRATVNAIGFAEPLPVKITTYRIPMEENQEPVCAVKCITHTKDVLDLLCEDTPELWEKVLVNVGLDEMRRSVRGTGTFLENRVFRNEVKALRHPRHRDLPFFRKWADALEIVLNRLYRRGWQPRRRNAFGNGLQLTAGEEGEDRQR